MPLAHRTDCQDREDPAFARDLADATEAMRAFLRRLCGPGDPELADELLQRAIARAWTYRASHRAGTEVGAWLRTAVLRVWIDERAARRRAPRSSGELDAATDDPGRRALEARDEVAASLARLKPIERDVLLRLHRDGQSVATIAAELGIPANTVKSHARRGRERLQRDPR